MSLSSHPSSRTRASFRNVSRSPWIFWRRPLRSRRIRMRGSTRSSLTCSSTRSTTETTAMSSSRADAQSPLPAVLTAWASMATRAWAARTATHPHRRRRARWRRHFVPARGSTARSARRARCLRRRRRPMAPPTASWPTRRRSCRRRRRRHCRRRPSCATRGGLRRPLCRRILLSGSQGGLRLRQCRRRILRSGCVLTSARPYRKASL
mmetsp:Transcript_139199/g.444877  ORF Transcript_139199/g.444877 Transcript_139199/m.444877 type:complete len:208 (-) Transcript_139199:850-1473(-)